jgi:hypothetical protein
MTSPEYTDVQRLVRIVGLVLSVVFSLVGLLFLFFPGQVIMFFNNLSHVLGMVQAPIESTGFYLILAVGYMYVVALLAYLMNRHPDNSLPLLVLINAKSASSFLSFAFFIVVHPYLIFLANGIVDGIIAGGLLLLRARMKGLPY